jgi:hypothetical protein
MTESKTKPERLDSMHIVLEEYYITILQDIVQHRQNA